MKLFDVNDGRLPDGFDSIGEFFAKVAEAAKRGYIDDPRLEKLQKDVMLVDRLPYIPRPGG